MPSKVNVRSFEPNAIQSSIDQIELLKLVQGSIINFINLYENLIPINAHLEDFLLNNRLDLLHPELFSWCYSLSENQLSKRSQINRWLEQFPQVLKSIDQNKRNAKFNEEKIGIQIAITQKVSSITIKRAKATAFEIYGDKHDIDIKVVKNLSIKETNILKEALNILKETWPEIHEEIKYSVKKIVFFDDPKVIGFVDFCSHGEIYLRRDTIENQIRLAEEILHESSHVRLNAILATDPLFENGDEAIYNSPLRRERRPMFGLFHQLFVLTRLKSFYCRLKNNNEVKRLNEIQNALFDAFVIVEKHALLTNHGNEMIDSIRSTVKQPI